MDIQELLTQPAITLGSTVVTLGQTLAALAAIAALLILGLGIGLWRAAKGRAISAAQMAERAREAEERMADILKSQAEMQGRMQTMAEIFGSRQSEMTQAIRERLDGMTHRIGQTMTVRVPRETSPISSSGLLSRRRPFRHPHPGHRSDRPA